MGRNSRTHNLACARKLDYVHAGLFMRAHEPAQKTLNFFFFFFLFLQLVSIVYLCLDPFSCIHGSRSLFHMFVCLFAFHMLKFGFILCFPCLMPLTCIHMLMQNVVSVELL